MYALSKNPENLAKLVEECPGVKTIACDLADWKATEKALENVEALDHLVNNAGVATREFLNESTEEVFDSYETILSDFSAMPKFNNWKDLFL